MCVRRLVAQFLLLVAWRRKSALRQPLQLSSALGAWRTVWCLTHPHARKCTGARRHTQAALVLSDSSLKRPERTSTHHTHQAPLCNEGARQSAAPACYPRDLPSTNSCWCALPVHQHPIRLVPGDQANSRTCVKGVDKDQAKACQGSAVRAVVNRPPRKWCKAAPLTSAAEHNAVATAAESSTSETTFWRQ